MKSKAGSASKPQPGGSGLLDRHMVARIENYALNNDYTDVDEVVEHLRRTHKEYQRKQVGPFRQMVIKAIGVIQRKGGVAKPELQLQVMYHPTAITVLVNQVAQVAVCPRHPRPAARARLLVATNLLEHRLFADHDQKKVAHQLKATNTTPCLPPQSLEEKHLASRSQQRSGSGSDSDDEGSGSDSDSGDGSSDAELAEDQAGALASRLNSSLLNMYTKTAAADAQPAASGDAQPPAGSSAGPSRAKEQPAFAPPHVIAAMAAKAAAEAKAAKAGSKAPAAGPQQDKTPAPGAAAGGAAADAMEAMSLDSQFAQQQTPYDRSAPQGETSGELQARRPAACTADTAGTAMVHTLHSGEQH
jgi:hypothetical protein